MLCDLAERLSGLFIMANRVKESWRGVLQNITMPRSWFINLILPDMDLGMDTSTFLMFVETLVVLMLQIDAQVHRPLVSASETWEQLIADGSRINNLTGSLYIGRM